MNSTATINRRRFLQTAAAAGVAGFAGAKPLRAAVAPSERLAIAVVGLGGIARHHASQFGSVFQVRRICDVDRSHLTAYQTEFAPQAKPSEDYREVITSDDIDAVFICTPDHWHAKIAIEALHAGKDVYCEKPLTLTIDQGRLLRQAVRDTGQVLQVGTQQRSDPKFQTAIALVHAGRLGAVKRVTAAIGGAPAGGPFSAAKPPPELDWDRWLGPAPAADFIPQRCHGNFRWWYEYSGGKLTDWGAHHVDIAQWAIAPEDRRPIEIEVLNAVHPTPLVEGMPARSDSYNTACTFHLRCTFADGVELDIRDRATDLGFENGILFEGEAGRLFVNRGKLTGRPVEQLADSPLPEDALSSLRKGQDPGDHYANFYLCCRDRTPPISDVDSHVLHLNTCHAANIAMRLDKAVTWNSQSARFAEEALNSAWLARPYRAGYEIAADA